MIEITDQQFEIFLSLFRGRTDVYAKRWQKGNKHGYSPAYEFDWSEFMSHRAKGGTMHNFKNKQKLPLTKEVIKNHLLGKYTVGIYPLLENNDCNFIVADFDKKNWKQDCRNFVKTCLNYKVPVYLERSRSGNGVHAWIFFEQSYPAEKIRKLVFELLREALNISEFQKEISFDRLFPNQDILPKGGFGNLIALPLNGKSIEQNNTVFIGLQSLKPIKDQWKVLENIKRVSIEKLDLLLDKICKPSVQRNPIVVTKKKDYLGLTITLDEQLYLDKEAIPSQMKIFLRDKLNFYNSEYLIKKRLGKSVYKVEKFFNLIAEKDGQVLIPRGFVKDLETFCTDNQISHEIVDLRKKKKSVEFKDNIKLYNYQQSAFEVCKKNDYGVIVAPPGAGKTILGLKLIVEKKQPALILVHRKQLLDQWVERIQSFLKIPKKDIGEISGSKKKIGKQITIGMIQSLVRQDDMSEYAELFGTIIVDECHHIPAKSFRETIVKFKPYYLYGLTATPKRKHNDEKLIFIYIGEILYIIDRKYKEEKKLGEINVSINDTKLELPFDFTIDNFQLLAKTITFDTSRNLQISKDIVKQVKKKSKVLVLSDRKDHIYILNQYLKGDCETITLTGDDSVSAKKSKLEQIKLGHFQVLLSTGQLFGEGMDIEHLDCLVLVFPFFFEGKLIQYIGRIQRSSKAKTILDYRDNKIGFLDRMFQKRNSYYKKLNNQLKLS